MSNPGVRIGVDVGGTFTDFVLLDPASGLLHLHKEPSTPDEPSRAVAIGFSAITGRAAVDPGAVQLISHGTTIGLNSIIQRKGARTALIVSRGSKDILELGRCKMRDPLNFFDSKEVPLVPRSHVIETDFRLDANGNVSVEPTSAAIATIAAQVGDLGVQSLAIAITNAYLAPELESRFAAQLAEQLTGVSITAVSSIWPEIREYERAMVGLMNAYIAPLMQNYFASVEKGLATQGFRGKLHITTSNGGTVSVATARERPIDTILSGPAAGVVATARFAEVFSQRSAITVDMGGTSSDMSVITEADVEYSTRAQVGDFPLFTPVVSVSAIGAGGGSVLWVDDFGVLKVGPESAGAAPGPACYGRGGTRATVTDCYVVCGLLSTAHKLGGQVSLSYQLARDAVAVVAAQLKFAGPDGPERAAWAALKVATSKMATELQKGLAVRGIDQKGYALIPFGGAGPTQAAMLAVEARLDRVVIPESPGTFCALGAALSDLKRDFSRTIRQSISGTEAASRSLAAAIKALKSEGAGWLEQEGDLLIATEYRLVADMRYRGQSYEIPVDLAAIDSEQPSDQQLTQAFHKEHFRVYRFADEKSLVEITSVRLTAVGKLAHMNLATIKVKLPPSTERPSRRIFMNDRWHEAVVLDRSALRAGQTLPSPAVIEQQDTTTVIPGDWTGAVDSYGNLVLQRKERT